MLHDNISTLEIAKNWAVTIAPQKHLALARSLRKTFDKGKIRKQAPVCYRAINQIKREVRRNRLRTKIKSI